MPMPISIGDAKLELSTGAVGFGEDHSNSAAREVIYALMKQANLVKHLVLELGEPWEDRGAWGAQFRSVVAILDKKWGNSFPFAKLIQVAALKGVHIHCWDPGDKVGLSLAKNTSRRNRKVSKQFHGYFNVSGIGGSQVPGCVILFGANHFNIDENSLDTLIHGLNWVDSSH